MESTNGRGPPVSDALAPRAPRSLCTFFFQASDMPWSTVGVNTNIISASMSALMDGLEYALVEFGPSCSLGSGPGASAAED